MAPARFLSVSLSGICASTNFQILPPGPRAWPSGPGAAGPRQVLDKWRRFIAPRFSPGFLPVPQGPNYIPGMEVQEKVVDLLELRPQSRPTILGAVFTRLHRTRQAVATTHSHHTTTVNCVNRVNCHQSRYSPMCSSSSPQRVTTTADWN